MKAIIFALTVAHVQASSQSRQLKMYNDLKYPDVGQWYFETHSDTSLTPAVGKNVGSCYNQLYTYYSSYKCDTAK